MPRYPDGVAFTVESKTAGQQKFQLEEQFVADVGNGYHESVAQAQADAEAAFVALYTSHVGGTREYRMVRCIEMAYEVRPV